MRIFTGIAWLIVWTMPIAWTSPALADRAVATEALARIDAQLIRSPVIRADFEQERTMRVLKRPLVTRGKVTTVAERGVLWQLHEPYEITVLMTAGSITEWDGTGDRRQLEAAPVFRALADTLLSLLSGDISSLANLFEPEPLFFDEGWELLLRPRDANLESIIQSIEIAGDRFVREAVIIESAGDRTKITFSNYRTEPDVLDTSEQSYFEQ